MPAHLRKDVTTGHLLQTAGHHLAKIEDACGFACTDCTTPETQEVVVTGLTACPPCFVLQWWNPGTESWQNVYARWSTAPTWTGGTWTIADVSSVGWCRWEATAPVADGAVTFYATAEDCANQANPLGTVAAASVTVENAHWVGWYGFGRDLTVIVNFVWEPPYLNILGSAGVFAYSVRNPGDDYVDCCGIWGGDSVLDDCNPGGGVYVAMTGGTATVTPSCYRPP